MQRGNKTKWERHEKTVKCDKNNNRLAECNLLGTSEGGGNSLIHLLETKHINLKKRETN